MRELDSIPEYQDAEKGDAFSVGLNDLLACPFCGGKVTMKQSMYFEDGYYHPIENTFYIECTNNATLNKCAFGKSYARPKEKLIAWWNQRVG